MQIKIIDKSNYDETFFYSWMGKYFAEPEYKKEMPYLANKPTHIWFLIFDNHKLAGFAAINELRNRMVFENSYVIKEYRSQGIWKELNKARFEYAKGKVLKVIAKEDYLEKYWIENGFVPYRKNGRYTYLRRDMK